jgi:glycosyltransferase involved in cell wall biosynthesis
MAVYSFPTIPALLASSMLGKPVVWSPRGMLQRWQGTTRPLLKSIWERICRIAAPDRMILHVTSDEEAEACVKRLPGAQTVVVPNSFEIPANVAPRTDQGPLRLLYLGRLHPIKGIENLLRAYAMINGDLGRDCSLTIAGAGDVPYAESLKRQVEQMTPPHRVEMVGAVTGEAKRKLFEHADVVIVPSFTENFGMVVGEALAHEVPVIASRGTPWQRLPEMGCGLWVDNRPESLAAAIKNISRMPLREMGRKGRAWMQEEFTDDVVAEKMIDLYRQVQKR